MAHPCRYLLGTPVYLRKSVVKLTYKQLTLNPPPHIRPFLFPLQLTRLPQLFQSFRRRTKLSKHLVSTIHKQSSLRIPRSTGYAGKPETPQKEETHHKSIDIQPTALNLMQLAKGNNVIEPTILVAARVEPHGGVGRSVGLR